MGRSRAEFADVFPEAVYRKDVCVSIVQVACVLWHILKIFRIISNFIQLDNSRIATNAHEQKGHPRVVSQDTFESSLRRLLGLILKIVHFKCLACRADHSQYFVETISNFCSAFLLCRQSKSEKNAHQQKSHPWIVCQGTYIPLSAYFDQFAQAA